MKEIDRYTIEKIGIPSMVLMERAALGVAEQLQVKTAASKQILAVCGTGNNGADGIAAARIVFLKDREADILLIGNEENASEETKQQFTIARNIGMKIFTESSEVDWRNYSVFVDALFGIGLSRDVEGEYKTAIDRINNTSADYILSVDIASGLSGNTGKVMGVAVQADATVTFGCKKTGMTSDMGKKLSGEVVVADIGYPSDILDRVSKQ